MFALTSISSSFAQHSKQTDTLNIVSYNIQIWPFYGDVIYPPNHKNIRTSLIPKALGANFDVIFFNEIFDKGLRENLVRQMSVEYPYWVDVANNYNPIILSSGVMAFSKWPIVTKAEWEYGTCYREECLAKKGALFIKIDKNGRYYNLFGTHPQSDNDQKSWQTRAQQMQEFKNFINAQDIPQSEPIILTGDFNIDSLSPVKNMYARFDEPLSELIYVQKLLNLAFLNHQGLVFSFDTELNKMTSLSNFTNGVRQALDHIWVISDHKMPNLDDSVEWYERLLSDRSEMRSTPDLSDHFPVMGTLVYEYPW